VEDEKRISDKEKNYLTQLPINFPFIVMINSRVYRKIHDHNQYLSIWLAQLVKAFAAPMHVCYCVQEVRVQSPEQTNSTLATNPTG